MHRLGPEKRGSRAHAYFRRSIQASIFEVYVVEALL